MSDLAADALEPLLGDRPLRSYPALLSTAADALEWARAGAASGAVVVADYQAAPRGRAGLSWEVRPGVDLCFSLVVRPERLRLSDEGWLYVAASAGLSDTLGDVPVGWPDTVAGGALGVHAEARPIGVDWAVINVLLGDVGSPRGPLLARAAAAIEARLAAPRAGVLADYLRRCETIDCRVTARMIPLGPSELRVTGVARTVKTDGALVLEDSEGRKVAVRPQSLGYLDPA